MGLSAGPRSVEPAMPTGIGRIPGGVQTYSKAPSRYPPGAPATTVRADGPYVWDETGRRWIDCVAGLGPVILGHRDPHVEAAVAQQLGDGVCFPTAHPLEAKLADLIADLVPGAKMCRFAKNGADVTMAAVRLARAVTQRERVVSIGYHGCHDWSLAWSNPRGIPTSAGDQLDHIRYGDSVALNHFMCQRPLPACLILEPVTVKGGEGEPPSGYLETARRLCDEVGALLIYDEIVTGFRVALGGAQEAWGAPRPDLICLGKAMGNGYPISAVVGRAEHMQRLTADDVFFSTTFGGDALGLAAAVATLSELRTLNVPNRLALLGKRLRGAYEIDVASLGLAGVTGIRGYPQRLVYWWTEPAAEQRFRAALVEYGLLHQGYINLMLAHERVELEIMAAHRRALETVAMTPVLA